MIPPARPHLSASKKVSRVPFFFFLFSLFGAFRHEVLYSLRLFLREFAKLPIALAVELAFELVDLGRHAYFVADGAAETLPVVRLRIVLDGLTRIHGLGAVGARDTATTQTKTIGRRLGAFFFLSTGPWFASA